MALPPCGVSPGLWLPLTEESEKSLVACCMAVSSVLHYHHCKAYDRFHNRIWGYKETLPCCLCILLIRHIPLFLRHLSYIHLEGETCILKLRKCSERQNNGLTRHSNSESLCAVYLLSYIRNSARQGIFLYFLHLSLKKLNVVAFVWYALCWLIKESVSSKNKTKRNSYFSFLNFWALNIAR